MTKLKYFTFIFIVIISTSFAAMAEVSTADKNKIDQLITGYEKQIKKCNTYKCFYPYMKMNATSKVLEEMDSGNIIENAAIYKMLKSFSIEDSKNGEYETTYTKIGGNKIDVDIKKKSGGFGGGFTFKKVGGKWKFAK